MRMCYVTPMNTEVRITLNLPADLARLIDAFRRESDELPTRNEAIRQLLMLALKAKGGSK